MNLKDRLYSKEKLVITDDVTSYEDSIRNRDVSDISIEDYINRLLRFKKSVEDKGYFNIKCDFDYGYYGDDPGDFRWTADRYETDQEFELRMNRIAEEKCRKKKQKIKQEEYEKKELARLMKKYKVKAE